MIDDYVYMITSEYSYEIYRSNNGNESLIIPKITFNNKSRNISATDIYYVDIPEIVRATTGWYTSSWELMKVGERITTMARAFNIREGLTKKDDVLPERFFHPHTSGALSETAIKQDEFKNAILTYYLMMGWDEDGIPTKSKLEELELDWIL